MAANLKDVRRFWEENPLWTGESDFEIGSRAYFEEHRWTVIEDAYAGRWDGRFLPTRKVEHVLDLGCGPGFWTIELAKHTGRPPVSVDLTKAACILTRARGEVYGVKTRHATGDAEHLPFPSGVFDHVNCQGVIHHTPDTDAAVDEIFRVLKPGGTASVSVYYKNVLVRGWPVLRRVGRSLISRRIGLRGRGRETLLESEDVDDLVRVYDGVDNPIGKSYTLREAGQLFRRFAIIQRYLHFFPARAIPLKIPRNLHRLLDRHLGFVIYFSLQKRAV